MNSTRIMRVSPSIVNPWAQGPSGSAPGWAALPIETSVKGIAWQSCFADSAGCQPASAGGETSSTYWFTSCSKLIGPGTVRYLLMKRNPALERTRLGAGFSA